MIAIGNTLETLTAFSLLSRLKKFDSALNEPYDYLCLALAGTTSAWVGSLCGNLILWNYGFVNLFNLLPSSLNWWLGDTFGMMLITPLILVWRQLPKYWLTRERFIETVICFSLAFLCGQMILLDWFSEYTGYPLGYWLFLFIAWVAIRYERHGVLLLILMILIQGLFGFIAHKGLFSRWNSQTDLLSLASFILVLTTIGLSLALIIKKRKNIEQALRFSEQRLLTAQRIARLGHWECNIEEHELFWSEQMYQIFDMPITQNMSYERFLERVHIDDRTLVEQAINNAFQQLESYNIDYRIYDSHGLIRFIHAQAELIHNAQGKLLMIGTVQDISERQITKEAMQLASLVYQNSSEAMMITDEYENIIATNPAFTTLTGYSEAEVIGKNPNIRKSGHQDEAFYQAMHTALEETGQWQGEIWNKRKTGEIRAEWLSINTIFNKNGSVYRRVALFYDVTEKKANELLIWTQANFDPLTGLANRHLFQERLQQSIKKAWRHRQSIVLLFLDLDHFKEINDSFGHSVGDALLKETSARLNSCVSETDTVARLGGDEFTLILTESHHINNVDDIAQNILNELMKPFYLEDKTFYISASMGITVYPNDADNTETLLKNADQAMYAAKAQGRNRYSYFTAAMEQHAQNKMQLATDLRQAISDGQFLVYYQPIITLSTGEIHKAEALIRWNHPERGFISPSEFIPIAEETGMIVDIGEWVFRQITEQLTKWRANYYSNFQISINKSPIQFYSKNTFYDSWPKQLKAAGLPGQSVVVEITEGMLLDLNEAIQFKLLDLHNANIQVSLDDFGTGYSSLSYLKKFDIDYLKIDKSFVSNLKIDSEDMALCEAIIVMAHKLGIKVIAEGIETAEQLDILAVAGCDYGQGYLFSKPVPANEFERLFK